VARKRNPRVDKLVQTALAELIERDSHDPRLAFVTITEVDVTPDHEVATVYYSTLDPQLVSRDPRRTGGDRLPTAQEVEEGLKAASPHLRGLLGRRVRLRTTPELRFVVDPVTSQAARVDDLLRRMDPPRDVPPGTGGIEDDGDRDDTAGPGGAPSSADGPSVEGGNLR